MPGADIVGETESETQGGLLPESGKLEFIKCVCGGFCAIDVFLSLPACPRIMVCFQFINEGAKNSKDRPSSSYTHIPTSRYCPYFLSVAVMKTL